MKISKLLFSALIIWAWLLNAAPVVRDGDKIAFIGDSITQFGNQADGFIYQVMDGLKHAGIKNLSFIPAGVGGDRSNTLLQRLPGILKQKPTLVIMKIGTNDVCCGERGVQLPEYKKNIRQIIRECQIAGARLLIVTPSMICEFHNELANKTLDHYCDFLRAEATACMISIADWNKNMHLILASKTIPGDVGLTLTIDHLHLNGYGNLFLAKTILTAMGIRQDILAQREKAWRKIPSMTPILRSEYNPVFKISIDDFTYLAKAAKEKEMTVDAYSRKIILDHLQELKSKP